MEKNNLDSLFQDRLKDFSETPNDRVWEKIEASLDKRKKKRVVPIWWQLGGAAAAIALLLYLVNPFASNDEVTLPSVVDTEEKIKETPLQNKNNTPLQNPKNTQIVATEDSGEATEEQNNTSAESSRSQETNGKDLAPGMLQNPMKSRDALAENVENQKEVEAQIARNQEKGNLSEIQIEKETGIAVNEEKQRDEEDQEVMSRLDKAISKEKSDVAVNENSSDSDKKSIYDVIAEKEDSEKEVVAENSNAKKWTMGPSLAPVFFSSLGEGSPIHSNFASNSKSGNLNLSYGLTVTYNISDKLSVRSGVHRVDYGYDTNDIVFTSSLTASTNQLIDNIDYRQTSRNLVVQSRTNNPPELNSDALVAQPETLEGRMVQQLGYIEVPMELNYALVDKKFGLHIIGGFSSLFLVDNAVSLESDQLITEMGEANNANTVNFSTNIGLRLNYELSQKLQLNVEPIFKYQLNTFSETAGNFRPYSVGVYSGLRFKF